MAEIYKLLFILIMVPVLLGYPRQKGQLLPGKRWYHKKGLLKPSFDITPLEMYSVTDPMFIHVPSFIDGMVSRLSSLAGSLSEAGSDFFSSNAMAAITGNGEMFSPEEIAFMFNGDNSQPQPNFSNLVRIVPAHLRDTLPGNVLDINFTPGSSLNKESNVANGQLDLQNSKLIDAVSRGGVVDNSVRQTETNIDITTKNDVTNMRKDVIDVKNDVKDNSVVIPLSLQKQTIDKKSTNAKDINPLEYYVGIPISLPIALPSFNANTNFNDAKKHVAEDAIKISKAKNPFDTLMEIQPFGRGPYADCRPPASVVCGARVGWRDVIGMDDWCAGNCVVFSYSSYCDDERCQCKCTEETATSELTVV